MVDMEISPGDHIRLPMQAVELEQPVVAPGAKIGDSLVVMEEAKVIFEKNTLEIKSR